PEHGQTPTLAPAVRFASTLARANPGGFRDTSDDPDQHIQTDDAHHDALHVFKPTIVAATNITRCRPTRRGSTTACARDAPSAGSLHRDPTVPARRPRPHPAGTRA